MNNDLLPGADMPGEQTDQWLVQFNKRDEKVFRGWHDAYYKPLTYFARKYIQDPEDIKDILQDGFVNVWKSPAQFATIAHLNNFLFKTTRNECLKFLRARGIGYRAMKEYGKLTETTESDPDLEKTHTELIREISQKMSHLPDVTLQVILLSILEDKTHSEIAQTLEISQTNAGVTKHRGLALLKEWLGLSKRDKQGPVLSLLLLLMSIFG